MSEKKNTYLQVVDAITAERRAWCQNAWEQPDPKDPTRVMSRCLVDHIDAVTGVYKVVGWRKPRNAEEREYAYDASPDGEGTYFPIVKKSADKRKWAKRDRLLAQLALLLPHAEKERYFNEDGTPRTEEYVSEEKFYRPITPAASDLVSFNDKHGMTRAGVLKLLRRAAATYPNA